MESLIDAPVMLLAGSVSQARTTPTGKHVALMHRVELLGSPVTIFRTSGKPPGNRPTSGGQLKLDDLLAFVLVTGCVDDEISAGPIFGGRTQDVRSPPVEGSGLRISPFSGALGPRLCEHRFPTAIAEVDLHRLLDDGSFRVISPSAAARSAHQTLIFSESPD